MFRRNFFKFVTLATTGAITPLEVMSAGASKTVAYHVRGFSCITCATGLDTMIRKEKGITSSSSTYPEGVATIGFDPEQTSEKNIKEFIAGLGFTVDDEHSPTTHPTQTAPKSK
jgi:copper chaperone CopZ